MSAIKDWCVVGHKVLTGGDDLNEPLQETMVWEVQHYNTVMYYNEIYNNFNLEEAEAMCKLLNQGECK